VIENVENEKLIVSRKDQQLRVSTTNNSPISSLEVYDILGRKIGRYSTGNSVVIIPNNIFNVMEVYILKAYLEDSKVLIKKVIP
jgi:hypothetical protein